jgi:HAMP domain-containing protein
MTLQTRILALVTGLLVLAVAATSAALTWNARQSLLEQEESDGRLIAELLAKTAEFADANANQAEHAIGEQMLVSATLAAHLVAVAERAGEHPVAINRRLEAIADETVLDEFWITDEHGHAYLRSEPEIEFTFSPDAEQQPQAHIFWALLTGQARAVVQEARKREIDDLVFKYAAVGGDDRRRIVQVGYDARYIEHLRQQVGLVSLADQLVASERIVSIQVVDPTLLTLAYRAAPGQTSGPSLSPTDAEYALRAQRERRSSSYLDESILKVFAPIVGAQDRVIGATIVQLPIPQFREVLQQVLQLAILVAAGVLVVGVALSILLSRRVTRPVARLTAAARAVEAAQFDPEILAAVAARSDELGQLGRVFQRMAREVQLREQRLKQQVLELRIEIDEARKVKEVAEITETEYFQQLQKKARALRYRSRET